MYPASLSRTTSSFFAILTAILLTAGTLPVFSQTPSSRTDKAESAEGCPNCDNKASAAAAAASAGNVAVSATGPRTSPFEPPAENDHSFITDGAPKLDTGCIYRSSGPITYNVMITRHVGALNSDGTLKNAAALVAAGLISRTATLIMPAFDVDSNATVANIQPERDRVSFNGEALGFLTGENGVWKLNSFEIPIEKVRFAPRGANGSLPTAAMNQVRIDIDTANTTESWCTSIDWGAQSFKATSPIILIHGNNSKGKFFEDRGFTAELSRQHLLFDNSINLPTTFIERNGGGLNALIPGIVKSFGVDSAHLIVHSKGGLDSREYLAKHQPTHDNEFKILSLTTLGSPHNGSAGADVAVARDNASNFVGVLGKIEYQGFPDYTRQLAALAGIDDGTRNLTTGFVAGFNGRVIPRLPNTTVYNTVAADADTNNNAQIDRTPDEYAELRDEDFKLRALDAFSEGASRYIVNAVYQILRNTQTVSVAYREEVIIPATPLTPAIKRKIATISSVPNPVPLGNDTLVTIPSALGVGSLQPLVTDSRTFTGAEGRNHASIVNGGVAATVIPWILRTERTRGDLR